MSHSLLPKYSLALLRSFLFFSALSVVALGETPHIDNISPTNGVPGTQVTFNGSGFGTTQGSSIVWLSGYYGTVVSWNDTQVIAIVSENAVPGQTKIQRSGVWSNTVTFTINPPTLTSISPTSGRPGTQVTFNGSGFGATQGTGQVWLASNFASSIVNWSDTQVIATVAEGVQAGQAKVQRNGVWSNQIGFTIPAPSITSISSNSAPPGAPITISGIGFGNNQGSGVVNIGTSAAASIVSWSDTQVIATVASGSASGTVKVKQYNVFSNTLSFTVMPAPSITTLSPTTGPSSTQVTITGTNFGGTQGSSIVKFNGTAGTPTNWNSTSIIVPVPAGATSGNVVVTVAGGPSNGVNFTVPPPPSLSQLTPTAGPYGTPVTLTGSNFGSTQGSGQVLVSGVNATVTNWNDSSIHAVVPNGVTTGQAIPVTVVTSNGASNGIGFTALTTPAITGITPINGGVNTQISISGTDFGSTQGTSTVSINGAVATVTYWSPTSITVKVPDSSEPGSGSIVVTTAGVSSNAVAFTVNPSLTSLAASSGGSDSIVSLNGANFGASQGSGSVQFGGTNVSIVDWTATTIFVRVPDLPVGSVPVSVSVAGSTTSTLQFSIVPTLNSLSPASGASGSSVTVKGSGFGTSGTVACNGALAAIVSWDDSTIVFQVPGGASSGDIVVTVNGYSTTGLAFEVVTTGGTPASLTITPENFSLLAGDSQELAAVDEKGNPVAGVTWSTSDSSIAFFADESSTVTGNDVGEATITATFQGLSTEANIKVYAGVSFPAGTVVWSNASPVGSTPLQTIQASPTPDGKADLFSIDLPSGSGISISGFSINGNQLWTKLIDGSSSSAIMPDRLGGLIVSNATGTSVKSLDGDNGRVRWIYANPTPNSSTKLGAIHFDGTVFAVSTTYYPPTSMEGIYTRPPYTYPSLGENHLVALDVNTGQPKFTVSIPQSHDNFSSGSVTVHNGSVPSMVGPLTVMPDGSLYFEVLATNTTSDSYQPTLSLIKVQNGTPTQQNLDSFSCSGSACTNLITMYPGEVIPDGQGGYLANWLTCDAGGCFAAGTTPQVKLSHSGTSYTQSSLSSLDVDKLTGAWLPGSPAAASFILGEENVAYGAVSGRIVAFDIDTGNTIWHWDAPGNGLAQLIGATHGGGLVAKYQNGSGEIVVRFDSTGDATSDSWTGTTAITLGAPAVGNLAFVAADSFITSPSSGGENYGGTSLVSSGILMDHALYMPWSSIQADRSSDPKVKVNLTVSSVYVDNSQDINTNMAVTAKVNSAREFWWKKAKIELQWDGTITPVKSCDPVLYQNGCSSNVYKDIAAITQQVTADEFLRRFCNSSGGLFNCTAKGSQVVFINYMVAGFSLGTTQGWTNLVAGTDGSFFNITALTLSAEDNDLAHELGHQFQLGHQFWVWPTNLMCSNLACPPHAGSDLNLQQYESARRGAKLLE